MKLIFQMIEGRPYLYKEDELHFEKVNPERQSRTTLLDNLILERECDMLSHGDNFYLIFDLEEDRSDVAAVTNVTNKEHQPNLNESD